MTTIVTAEEVPKNHSTRLEAVGLETAANGICKHLVLNSSLYNIAQS